MEHIVLVLCQNKISLNTNGKGVTSQNFMEICDFDMRFNFVVVGWPGSVHGTRVCLVLWLNITMTNNKI
jgi:hypothetical protein